jgi:superfamily II DNA/RNA helicase
MTKAIVKTKSGMSISIEGTQEEVKDILSLVREREEPTTKKARTASSSKIKTSQTKFSATDAILRLKEEEAFFNKHRTLLDIKRALEERGLHYPITTLSGTMLNQVRKRNFKRFKENKNWVYVKEGKS